MASGSQIQSAYIDYVLTNNERPKSVYNFAKKLKMTEAEILQFIRIIFSDRKNYLGRPDHHRNCRN